MIRGPAALAALATLILLTTRAFACPDPSAELLFHSCWGKARIAVLLVPEDLPVPPPPDAGRRLTVTGAYTATDKRAGDLRKPVGLFVHGGHVINPNLARMDGVLIVDPATGQPTLQYRNRVHYGGTVYDLTELAQRRAFLKAAAAGGVSVLQSHLLIIDGRIDVAAGDAAPTAVRRMLFIDDEGFGVFQTSGPETLRGAAERLSAAVAPRMALNLDMGSYDFCLEADKDGKSECGALALADLPLLSNLITLSLK